VNRGDIVLVATPGDFGKPRPALIVQSRHFSNHPSMTVCLLTTHLHQTPLFRFHIEPAPGNGLASPSDIQIDKMMTLPREKIGQVIGRVDEKQLSEITKLLALWVGIAD